jgi:hypothetical protein
MPEKNVLIYLCLIALISPDTALGDYMHSSDEEYEYRLM